MSYTFLREQGEVSSVGCFSDIPRSVLSKLNLTAEKSSYNGNETAYCQNSRSGTMCEPLTGDRGEDSLTSCVAGFHVRTSALREKAQDLTGNVPASGRKCGESLARYDHDSCLWRTHQYLLLGDLDEFLETWPKWGLMQDGVAWGLTGLDCPTKEPESGYWPTPSGVSNHGRNHVGGRLDEWGGSSNPFRGTEIGKMRLPTLEEWMMDWPVSWTELTPLGMGKFHRWLHSHGKY